jgi:phage antirepressor YoqD-like protein
MEIAKEYRIKPNNLYRLLYELEVLGKIKPIRKNANWLELREQDVREIRKALENRGHFRVGEITNAK